MSLKIPFGKYYLTEKIATGGMAELYRAKRIGVAGFEKLLVIKRFFRIYPFMKSLSPCL